MYSGLSHEPDIKRIINNDKVSDHFSVIPTVEIAKTDIDSLPDGERKILLLVVNKLLCATAEKHEYESITATIECGRFSFSARGKTVTNEGWKAIERLFKEKLKCDDDFDERKVLKSEREQPLNLTEGQVIEHSEKLIAEHQTSPPRYFTEDTLLSAMETAGNKDYDPDSDTVKKGIGTPATRAGTIEKLLKVGYIVRSNKNLLITEKGEKLIAIVSENIKTATMTVEWETALQEIERGGFSPDYFMDLVEKQITEIAAIEKLKAKASAVKFTDDSKKRESLGKCPKCGGNVMENAKAYSCTAKCGFCIWKTMSGKSITVTQAKKLLKDGKTDNLTGFKKKNGEVYEGVLKVKPDFKIWF
jgi:DNA topoisomerase-3